jgi:hypothetical protein
MGVAAQVWIVPIVALVAAVMCACIAILRALRVPREIVIDKLLRYLFVFPLGLGICRARVLSGSRRGINRLGAEPVSV